jgi:hypothetical protein
VGEQKPLTETVRDLRDQAEREVKAKIAAQPPRLVPTVDPNEARAIGSRLAVEVDALWDALATMAVEIDALRRRLGE